ncbi:MAG: 1-acyl-sn-glycerol-3-phosphate acyltransferase [Rikenellaceae bacterium]
MKLINIRELIASKSKRLAKFLPEFVYRFLEKILHQDEVNKIISGGLGLNPQEFIRSSFRQWRVSYNIIGLDKIDPSGRYIFASNHPFGGMDGMMIADLLIDHFSDARVVVNDILMHITPLAPIWIPVNTMGAQNSEYARIFEEGFSGDLPILIFPAGVCSRVIDGEIKDLKWKNTFLKRARASKRTIIPLYVQGSLHKGFYRLYKWRKALGVKAPIEMLLLVDGMFKQYGKTFTIVVGEPIADEVLLEKGSLQEQVAYVRERTYDLAKTL